jgi:hypothetical protein
MAPKQRYWRGMPWCGGELPAGEKFDKGPPSDEPNDELDDDDSDSDDGDPEDTQP